ncbi:MAG: hypothetical protein JXA43_02675 [Candidatus Diapherotrites archaeon]|nr:hypothetical protein [Candidatus Diapherotrites archaeon]
MKNIYAGKYKLYLILPVILFITFSVMAMGVQRGLELSGGTLVSVQIPKDVDVSGLDRYLESKFSLSAVTVTKIENPLGAEGASSGILIKFAENPLLENATKSAEEAQEFYSNGNNNEAMAKATETINLLSSYVGSVEISNETKEAVNQSFTALADAKQKFNSEFTDALKEKLGVSEFTAIEFRTIGPSLGNAFMDQARDTVVVAFILMTIVVIFFFRDIVPSLAIILSAILDVLCALAAMNLFGFPLTLASITALLMMVGYSVDTDILLTTRLLKRRQGTPDERAMGAMGTGLTMTFTTLAAVTVLFVISTITQMSVVTEIAFVLMAGILGDIISTWAMNAPMLLWYVEAKHR